MGLPRLLHDYARLNVYKSYITTNKNGEYTYEIPYYKVSCCH